MEFLSPSLPDSTKRTVSPASTRIFPSLIVRPPDFGPWRSCKNSDGAPHFHFERTYRRVKPWRDRRGCRDLKLSRNVSTPARNNFSSIRRRSAGWPDGGNDLGSTLTSHVQISLSAASGDQDRRISLTFVIVGRMDQVSDLSHSVLELLQLRLG